MSDYTIGTREQATDYMAEFPGFGEMRSFTDSLDCQQVAFTWRLMPPGTGGRGSYGHRHKTQEEIYFVAAGTLTFKVGADVFEAGPGTAVRIAAEALRAVHNDTDDEVQVMICSTKIDDVRADTITEDDFWPEAQITDSE